MIIKTYYYYTLLSFAFFLFFSGIFGRVHKDRINSAELWLYNSRIFGGIVFIFFVIGIFLSSAPSMDFTNSALKFSIISSVFLIFDSKDILNKNKICIYPIFIKLAKVEFYLGLIAAICAISIYISR